MKVVDNEALVSELTGEREPLGVEPLGPCRITLLDGDERVHPGREDTCDGIPGIAGKGDGLLAQPGRPLVVTPGQRAEPRA
ncbi:hypothetical protein [Rubrobacter indicoceani]|uniref:hypothetical protein n=1 Tax=Rubrobacter indicoceani TaxID=2051957 RepID=UPI000E5BEDA7|nr:hypothetical protein [Rubrobacter indicoceani]